jgi:hypothetical protein
MYTMIYDVACGGARKMARLATFAYNEGVGLRLTWRLSPLAIPTSFETAPAFQVPLDAAR